VVVKRGFIKTTITFTEKGYQFSGEHRVLALPTMNFPSAIAAKTNEKF
jgi:hypothetical protein